MQNKIDTSLDQCCLVIPALNPTSSLTVLVSDLKVLGFRNILVINDGSDAQYASTFEDVKRVGATVIEHSVNMGKGVALKTAFKYCIDNHFTFATTLDADGQHLPSDVLAVVKSAIKQAQPSAVLGVRHFVGDVPLRSRFGNELTKWIFWKISGVKVKDTQTGLRCFHSDLFLELLALTGDRYEYEMNVLMYLAKNNFPIIEVPIETVYLDGNSSSHFRPLIDSLKIYSILFRDAFLALSSFGLDVALFNIILALTSSISIATYISRLISGSYNFIGNKLFVFRQFGLRRIKREVLSYATLAILLAIASSNLVTLLVSSTSMSPTLCKIIVDLSLYAFSFVVRKVFIFKI